MNVAFFFNFHVETLFPCIGLDAVKNKLYPELIWYGFTINTHHSRFKVIIAFARRVIFR